MTPWTLKVKILLMIHELIESSDTEFSWIEKVKILHFELPLPKVFCTSLLIYENTDYNVMYRV